MNNKLLITTILCSALSGVANADTAAPSPVLAPAQTPATAPAPEATMPAPEKCYNIAKAGMNDCAAADGSHSCKGYATKDASPVDHILLPNGLCNKIVGSSLSGPRV